MQKWEYCALLGVQRGGAGQKKSFVPTYPALWKFTLQGYEESQFSQPEQKTVAQTIAQLGDDGWEMVGTGVVEYGQVIYFKRPKP